jgi:chitinase
MFEGRTTGMWIGSGPRVIPPGASREDNPDGLPQVVRLQHEADFAFVAADYSAAYRNHDGPRVDWPYADRAVREFLFVRPLQALVILDRMRASGDSLLPFYNSPDWLLTGPHVSAAQVRRTFAMHFETAPSVAGARVTAVNGGQTTDLITLVPAGPAYRIVNEDRPGDEQSGQYRLELDSTGAAESYFLQVVHGRDNGTAPLTATVVDRAGDWVLTLTGQGGQTATITLLKGMTSAGGSIALNGGPATPLRADVQAISVTSDGPAWGGASAPLPSLSIDDAVIAEGNAGAQVLNFTVRLSKPAETPVTFSIATTNGTAVAGSDYVARTLTGQTIPAGQSTRTFAVTVNGDTTVETNETIRAVVSAVAGAVMVDDTGIGVVLNDDGANLRVADVSVTEGNAGTKAMTFTVSTPVAAAGPITYTLASSNGNATAGSDYTAVTYPAQTLAAGMLGKTHTVTIAGDGTVEPNERLVMSLTGVSGATVYDGQAIGTILNDDGPTLSIADISVVEGNSGTTQAIFTVKLSQAASVPVTYSIATGDGSATAGSDFTARSLVGETIPAGALSRTFVVDVTGDTSAEANEWFTANLTAASGATILDGQAMAGIRNDDGLYLWIDDAATTEGNSGTKLLTFTVHLSQAAPSPQTFDLATSDGTATVAGTDYVAKTATAQAIPAGMTSKTFAVTLNGDAAVEANETFRVTLTNAAGPASVLDGVAFGTITNDD